MSEKKSLWFKRKRYGYGSSPSTLQGWALLTAYVAVIIGSASLLLKDAPEKTYTAEVGTFTSITLAITLIFLLIGYKKSPSSKWRWGIKPSDNPEEDQ
jgi:hypothetical protein